MIVRSFSEAASGSARSASLFSEANCHQVYTQLSSCQAKVRMNRYIVRSRIFRKSRTQNWITLEHPLPYPDLSKYMPSHQFVKQYFQDHFTG